MGATTSSTSTGHISSYQQSRRPSGSESELRFPPVAPAGTAEDRNQLIARRRAAQRAWRTAGECVERASQLLVEAMRTTHLATAVSAARARLEHARLGEQQARSSYYRVAQETGALLSRLQHVAARRT
jgi:hypothetical protein